MTSIPRGHLWARRIAIVSTAVMVVLLTAWVRSDPRLNLTTDWTSFDNAAERLFDGESVYRPWNAETEQLPYLYPPFVLWLSLPLGLLGFFGSWAFSAALTLGAFVAGIRLLARTVPEAVDPTTGLIVATASGTVVTATLIGQYGGIYVFSLGLAVWLWNHDRELLAGVALSLLVMKPNLAAAVPVVLVWSRSWPALRGFGLGAIAAVVASVPFGLDKWSAFVDNVRFMTDLQKDDELLSAKMVTVVGAAQAAFGWNSGISSGALVVWVTSAAVLGLATIYVWQRGALQDSPARAFGVLATFIAVANPRLYFYDATLVIFGLLALWLTLDRHGGELAKRWVPPLCAAIWVFLWGGVFKPLNLFVGPLTAVVILVVALDMRSQRSSARSEGRQDGRDLAVEPPVPV